MGIAFIVQMCIVFTFSLLVFVVGMIQNMNLRKRKDIIEKMSQDYINQSMQSKDNKNNIKIDDEKIENEIKEKDKEKQIQIDAEKEKRKKAFEDSLNQLKQDMEKNEEIIKLLTK